MKPRWITETDDNHSQWYVDRFRQLAAEGADLGGEARLMDAITVPGSRILDAGCGLGRIGAILHERGHRVVGVDVDPVLIEAAKEDHPGPEFHVGDLSTFDLTTGEGFEPFDAAVVAGNVMVFVAQDSEQQVLGRIAAHVRPGGKVVVGCRLDWHYSADALTADAEASGLLLQQRFATWDLEPFTAEATFAVSIFTRI